MGLSIAQQQIIDDARAFAARSTELRLRAARIKYEVRISRTTWLNVSESFHDKVRLGTRRTLPG
jgi:hypothetical protein